MIEIGLVITLKIRFNNSGTVASVAHPVLALGIDKDSFVQIDNIIQLEIFPKLESKRRQTDKLCNEKFNKVLKRYNEYKDNEWIDDNKKGFYDKRRNYIIK